MGYELNSPISSVALAELLELQHCGAEIQIASVAALSEAVGDCLTYAKEAMSSQQGVSFACIASSASITSDTGSVLTSSNPRLAFIRALNVIDDKIGFKKDESAPAIDSTAVIGERVVIEPGVTIGARTRVDHGVVIKRGTVIGADCLIHENVSIGGDGFGFERDESGCPVKFIHLGGVSIGDRVEIGAGCCVAKGTLGDTVIESDVKLDNLVHVAHNCCLKKGALITACVGFSGGVTVGEHAWVGPNASIIQKVRIGKGAFVGIGSVVIRDVDDGQTVVGNPARVLSKNNKQQG